MRKELVIKFGQVNSEGFILLPSKYGIVILRDKLLKDKIKHEEIQVAFAGKQVTGFKFDSGGYTPKFYHRETFLNRNEDVHYLWYGTEDTGMRIKFSLPVYVEVPEESQ